MRTNRVCKVPVLATILVVFFLFLAFAGSGQASGSFQVDPTPTPGAINRYVDIDGNQMAIVSTVTIGDMALFAVGLGILTTLFVYVAYRIVVDKLP